MYINIVVFFHSIWGKITKYLIYNCDGVSDCENNFQYFASNLLHHKAPPLDS